MIKMSLNAITREFLVKNFVMVLNYVVIYILLLSWKESVYIDRLNLYKSDVRIFQFVMILLLEILFMFGYYLLFKEFLTENKKDFIITGIFYLFFTFPMMSPLITPQADKYFLVFQVIGGSLLLYLGNLAIFMHNNRNLNHSHILRQKSYKTYFNWLKTKNVPLYSLKNRLYSTNVLWAVCSLISIFLLCTLGMIWFASVLLISINLIFAYIYGLFKSKPIEEILLKSIMSALLFSMAIVYLTQSFSYDSEGFNIVIVCIIILCFQFIVNQLLIEEHLLNPEKFTPILLKKSRLQPKNYANRVRNQKLIILGVSLVVAIGWSLLTIGLTYLIVEAITNWPTFYVIINSILGTIILLYAQWKKYQGLSNIKRVFKFLLTGSFFFGLHVIYTFSIYSIGNLGYMIFLIGQTLILFLYLFRSKSKNFLFDFQNLESTQKSDYNCPNCKMNIDEEMILALSDHEFIFCKFCGEKIRKPQIIAMDEDTLLKEHQNILKKLVVPPPLKESVSHKGES